MGILFYGCIKFDGCIKYELCSTANDWKDTDMLKRLPTLLSGKAFAVFERLAAEAKENYKTSLIT
jgi:hypothetical protein